MRRFALLSIVSDNHAIRSALSNAPQCKIVMLVAVYHRRQSKIRTKAEQQGRAAICAQNNV